MWIWPFWTKINAKVFDHLLVDAVRFKVWVKIKYKLKLKTCGL